MKVKGIDRVAVLGAGIMGHGIAQLFATSGYEVHLMDISEEILQKALDKIKWSMDKLVSKKMISEAAGARALELIKTFTSTAEAVDGVDLVVEAVPEVLELKQKVFKQVSDRVGENVIIASNTSDIRISTLAESVKKPGRFLGLHFLNPPPLMPMIEIVKGEKTSDAAVATAKAIVESLGKWPAVMNKDRDLADLLVYIVHEILWQLEEGAATVEEIDATFRQEGFPMGQFELMDYGGLDTGYHVLEHKNMPIPSCLAERIKANQLGMKTGQGFYDWSSGRPKIDLAKAGKFDIVRGLARWVNASVAFVEEGVASKETVDQAFSVGQAFPYGPFQFADDRGIDAIVQALKENPRAGEPHPKLVEMVKAGWLGKKTGRGFYDYAEESAAKSYQNIIIKTENGVSIIMINRPHKLNAMNLEAIEEMKHALTSLRKAGQTRCLVIRGAPPAFSAGADLGSEIVEEGTLLRRLEIGRQIKALFEMVEDFPTPVIAAIDGFALGGGCELSLACDTRIASERSEIGLPEVHIGALPGAGGTQRLIRLIGLSRAKDMVMRGRRLSAREAYEYGLVNILVPDDKFEEEVQKVAQEYAAGPPVALHLIKMLMNRGGADAGLEGGLEMETLGFAILSQTADLKEGVAAFVQKRKPEFQGK